MNIENILSNFIYLDLVIIISLFLVIYFWIYKKGLKDIILLTLNLYIVNFFISILVIRSLGLGIINDNLASLLLYFVIIFLIFFFSQLRKNLMIYSQKLLINIFFTISFLGLVMVTLMKTISLDNYLVYTFLKNNIFVTSNFSIIWYILPLLGIAFMTNKKLKR